METTEQTYQQLPLEARQLLDLQTPSVRAATLTTVGHMMERFEGLGAKLDPIQGEIVLTEITEVIAWLVRELKDEKNLITMILGAE